MNNKRVALYNMGCRLNSAEASTIADTFAKNNYEIVEFGEEAEITFINSCTVTDSADSSCRNIVRKAQRFSPNGKIIVAGCYAQVEGEKLRETLGVHLVLGNAEKMNVFDYLNDETSRSVVGKNEEFFAARSTSLGTTTRAFLKIQDGCNYFCSYCIIPFARGRARGISISNALEEARALLKDGFKEIVLTGINMGEYQKTTGERFETLVKELLSLENEGLKRFRISSIEPNTITDELLEITSSSKVFMPHWHVPIQSGSDEILKLMKRKYDKESFAALLTRMQKAFPQGAIGTDIILGFPGETKELFQESYDFLDSLPITHFHVFPYSKRTGTLAAKMPDHLTKIEKKERVHLFTKMADRKLSSFASEFIDQDVEVLFEQRLMTGEWVGHTPHFIECILKDASDLSLKNELKWVKVKSAVDGQLHG